MNEVNALKFANDFNVIVKGLPINKMTPNYIITRVEVVEQQNGTFEVMAIGEDKNEPEEMASFLINVLTENEIPFDRQEYQLPPIN